MIKIFADTAKPEDAPGAAGYTTNPTIIKNSVVKTVTTGGEFRYETWARDFAARVAPKPASFEVISDTYDGIMHEALTLNRCGANVYVKVPIVNALGGSNATAISMLNDAKVKVNVTAVLTDAQVLEAIANLKVSSPAIISIFAGRIADTGVDPAPTFFGAVLAAKAHPHIEILWASARQVRDAYIAEAAGAHIITLSPDLIKKLPMRGMDLRQLSIDTARQFRDDAFAAGLKL